jgi:maltooligosyltrehalose trehalohydrolase
MLFQGEEWGASAPFLYFTDHEDRELGRKVTEGRRREFAAFGWRAEEIPDPQAHETFERSRLDWNERGKEPHAGLLAWHRRLIELRREIPALSDGAPVGARFDESALWFTLRRGPITIACNLRNVAQPVPVEEASRSEVLLASDESVRLAGDAIELPPDAVAIVRGEENRR